MKPSSVGRVLLILFFLSPCSTTFSQQSNSTAIPLESLKSPDWERREVAYEKIRDNTQALQRSDVRNVLVDLLDLENQVIHRTLNDSNGGVGVSGKYGEGYSEYILQLVGTVGKVMDWHDPHQVCVLSQTAYEPGTVLADKIAVKGGAAAVPCLLKMVEGRMYGRSDSPEVRLIDRDKSIPVLVQLSAVTKDLSPSAQKQIQQAITGGLQDSSTSVREDTVQAVGKFGTPDVIPTLEAIARSDPYSWLKDGKQFFEIRELATKAIKSIRERAAKAPSV